MDLPVSPVFPNTPNGRKQYLHWRQQHRLRSAGRTPPHVAADDPSASTRLEMDDIVDSDDEHNPKEEEEALSAGEGGDCRPVCEEEAA